MSDVEGVKRTGDRGRLRDWLASGDILLPTYEKLLEALATGYITGGGGVTDHGELTGLEDDDHNQYHNDSRGDEKYYTKSQVNSIQSALQGEIDTDVSTHAELANVHHMAFESEDCDDKIATHTQNASAHHTRYADSEAKAAAVSDAAYGSGWGSVTDIAPSKKATYDKIQTLGGAPPTTDSLMMLFRGSPFTFTDFLGVAGAATIEAAYPFDFATANSGTQAKIAGEASHPGILRISSSTTTNSGGYCVTEATSFLIAGGECFEMIFQHRVASGTSTTIRFGYLDTISYTDATDGVYFEFPSSSLALVGKTASNGTRSTTNTIYTCSVNTWYRARLVVNADATSVTFYLYSDAGSLLGSQTLTTNIPKTAGRETGAGVVATNVGTTAVLLCYLDWMALWQEGRVLTR